jgi:hypothetical protein
VSVTEAVPSVTVRFLVFAATPTSLPERSVSMTDSASESAQLLPAAPTQAIVTDATLPFVFARARLDVPEVEVDGAVDPLLVVVVVVAARPAIVPDVHVGESSGAVALASLVSWVVSPIEHGELRQWAGTL